MVPEFSQLTKPIEEIYNKCKENKDGKVMLQFTVKSTKCTVEPCF